MTPVRGTWWRAAAVLGLVLGAAGALIAGGGSASPAQVPAIPAIHAQTAASLLLDECDPGGYVACNQQAAFLSVPIADTGLSLTYSSQWAPARSDRPDWSASNLGLGGWSVNVLQGYDAAQGVLVGGDGTWRLAQAVPVGSGDVAVPSYDGTLGYVFNSAGRQVRTVDGHLGMTLLSFAYDPAGALEQISGTVNGAPVGLRVRRASSGAPTALVGVDGALTSLSLGPSGDLVALRGPGGPTAKFTWQSGGLVTSETDPMGAITHFRYGSGGLLVSQTGPDGVTQHLRRSAMSTSVEVRVTTGLGRVSAYYTELFGSGVRRRYIAPGGAITTETTQADGSFSLSLPDGTTSTVGEVPGTGWGLSAPVLSPVVTTAAGSPTSRTEVHQDLSEVDGMPYTVTGTVTTTVNGEPWVESFDPAARTTTVVDPAGLTTANTYDSGGRLLATSTPGSPKVTFAYNAKGRLAGETIGVGRLAQTTRWAYDAQTGAVTVTRPDRSTITEGVDTAGDPATIKGPNGATVIETYDADGLLTAVQSPGGATYALGYSAAGRPTAFLAPSLSTGTSIETATYDRDGELKSISGLGTKPVTLAYNAAGEVTGVSFDQGTATASYSPTTGMLSAAKDPDGVSTTFGYSARLPDKLTWSGPVRGSVTDNYDANGRPVSESVDGGPATTFAYDGAGNLTTVGPLSLVRSATTSLVTGSTLGAVQTAYRYDANDLLIGATTTAKGRALMSLGYTRDALGRVTSVAESGPAGAKTTTDYTYNSADLLSTVIVNGRRVEADSYDEVGNRTAVTTPAGTTRAIYNADNQLVRWGKASYSWATDGNLSRVSDGAATTSYSFDDLGRLRQVRLPEGEVVTYLVDAQGQRIGREVDGRLVAGYLYDPAGQVVAETNGAGTVVARYGYDQLGHLALVEEGGNTYRVVTDQNGSPLLVVNSKSGAVADAITYNPWGQVTSQTAPGTLPFGFDGGLVDPATGLVHFGARDYDPTTGRWTEPDPIGFAGGDADLYRFAADDPINNVDPTGLDFGWNVSCLESSAVCGGYACEGTCSFPYPESIPPAPGASCLNAFYCSASSSPGNPDGDPFGECALEASTCNTSSAPSAPTSPPTSGSNGNLPPGCDSFGCSGDPLPDCSALGCNDNLPPGCDSFGCSGNPPPGCDSFGCSGSYGDTHLTTGGELHYNFQAAGEFTAIESPDGPVDVQVRQQPAKGETSVTFATAVAANVDGDRVGVYALEPWFLRVNGTVETGAVFRERLPHGGTVTRNGDSVTVRWPDGGELAIALFNNFAFSNFANLSYSFTPAPGTAPTLTGLLGTGNTYTQLVDSSGTTLLLSDPKFEKKLYSQFANSWRISRAESLFDYRPGESTATFTNLKIPYSNYTVASLSASARAKAEAICGALGVRTEPLLDDCILDVGVTGDPGLAAAEAQVAAAGVTTPTAPSPVAAGALGFAEASNLSFPGHSGTVLHGVSCPSGSRCVAVGQDLGNYAGANGTIEISDTGAGWTPAPVAVPSPPPAHGVDTLGSVSCWAPGTCAAVGDYESSKGTLPLVETETGSVWQPAASVALPAGATFTAAVLNGVSCTSSGTCLAVGGYQEGIIAGHAMAVLSTGGHWAAGAQALEVHLPTASDSSPVLNAVSCAGTGCLAVGGYEKSFYVHPGMAVAESGGHLQRAVEVVPPASDPTFVETTLSGVSCTGPATCAIAGTYRDPTGGVVQAMVASEVDGAWRPSVPVKLPANGSGAGASSLNGIWCHNVGGLVPQLAPNCVAVGSYSDNAGVTRPMYVDDTDGHWAQAVELAVPAADGSASLNGVACSPGGVCAAVGTTQHGDGIVALSTAMHVVTRTVNPSR
ncbi:MAG TPA: RHS repeat-associated core domain-containing protein [Acidimicrobiales bacterium]|nr:RHS repeat-associated core domain-containing protein [Acidimicrobiales bacterium]